MRKYLEDYFGESVKLQDGKIIINRNELLEIADPGLKETLFRRGSIVPLETRDQLAILFLAALHRASAPPTNEAGLPLVNESQSIVSQNAFGDISLTTRKDVQFMEHKLNF